MVPDVRRLLPHDLTRECRHRDELDHGQFPRQWSFNKKSPCSRYNDRVRVPEMLEGRACALLSNERLAHKAS
jgi:hypothetical protein